MTRVAVSLLSLKSKSAVYPSTKNMMFCCPYHRDKTPSMGIDLEGGRYHCFSCGRSGSIENLFYDLTGTSLKKTLGIKDDPFSNFAFKVDYEQFGNDEEDLKLKDVHIVYDPINIENAWDNIDCRRYLINRGITKEACESMGFQYTEDTTFNCIRYTNRLLIPVYEGGKLLSMEGRRITDDPNSPKVLYPKNSTTSTLFDIDHLDREKTLFAMEGLMDLAVLRTYPLFRNSTSIFGANLTKRQIMLLKEFNKGIVYIPDLDKAGDATVLALKDAGIKNVQVLRPPESIDGHVIKDVGDLGKIGYPIRKLVERKWLNYMIKVEDFKPKYN